MTRKDYSIIAEAVASVTVYDMSQQVLLENIITALSNVLEENNPRFDRVRFASACLPE